MDPEYEIRILEINVEEIIKKLEELNATYIGDFFQKRKVYDFKPKISNKWIRLRSNGKKTTLAIKEVSSKEIDGTKELEVEVADFAKMDLILNQLGYDSRAYQENKRKSYQLDNVEIEIDTWPLIPTYLEIYKIDIDSYKELKFN